MVLEIKWSQLLTPADHCYNFKRGGMALTE